MSVFVFSTHQVVNLESISLFLAAVPSDGGDVEHACPELNEGSPEFEENQSRAKVVGDEMGRLDTTKSDVNRERERIGRDFISTSDRFCGGGKCRQDRTKPDAFRKGFTSTWHMALSQRPFIKLRGI